MTKARQQATERQTSARNLKSAFLKKLNKILLCCLMLCMDLCGWGTVDAIKLLGDEVSPSVQYAPCEEWALYLLSCPYRSCIT